LERSKPIRNAITYGCDVALTALLYWQAVDALMPATVIVTGIVLAIRTAASLPVKNRS